MTSEQSPVKNIAVLEGHYLPSGRDRWEVSARKDTHTRNPDENFKNQAKGSFENLVFKCNQCLDSPATSYSTMRSTLNRISQWAGRTIDHPWAPSIMVILSGLCFVTTDATIQHLEGTFYIPPAEVVLIRMVRVSDLGCQELIEARIDH